MRGWRGCSEEALKVVEQLMRHRAAIPFDSYYYVSLSAFQKKKLITEKHITQRLTRILLSCNCPSLMPVSVPHV
jgi:hypothetical protein